MSPDECPINAIREQIVNVFKTDPFAGSEKRQILDVADAGHQLDAQQVEVRQSKRTNSPLGVFERTCGP